MDVMLLNCSVLFHRECHQNFFAHIHTDIISYIYIYDRKSLFKHCYSNTEHTLVYSVVELIDIHIYKFRPKNETD